MGCCRMDRGHDPDHGRPCSQCGEGPCSMGQFPKQFEQEPGTIVWGTFYPEGCRLMDGKSVDGACALCGAKGAADEKCKRRNERPGERYALQQMMTQRDDAIMEEARRLREAPTQPLWVRYSEALRQAKAIERVMTACEHQWEVEPEKVTVLDRQPGTDDPPGEQFYGAEQRRTCTRCGWPQRRISGKPGLWTGFESVHVSVHDEA